VQSSERFKSAGNYIADETTDVDLQELLAVKEEYENQTNKSKPTQTKVITIKSALRASV
jgi:hypothetical protein